MVQYFVVALQQNRMIVVKEQWVLNPRVGQYTKVYVSPNEQNRPNFLLPTRYLLNILVDACYNARVMKVFKSKEDAEYYASWKRPEYFQRGNKRFLFKYSTIVDTIHIDVSIQSVLIRYQFVYYSNLLYTE